MPPKKRGRPAGTSSAAPQRPTKRVRVGETSIIGTQDSTELTDSGRPRRSSAGEANYSTKRAKAPNNVSAASSKTAPAAQANVKKRRKRAAKLFGKRRVSAMAKPEVEVNEAPKRGRGRPKKATSETTVKEKPATPKKAVGRPKKAVGRPAKGVGRPKKNAEDMKSINAPVAKQKGRKTTANHEEEVFDDEVEDSKGLPNSTSNDVSDEEETESDRQYWLMKAEPDSRLENGVDVKFSIDDLRAKGGPEAWDGVRSLQARNNLRAMRKGDHAFFYHSNCKVPGIVGVMEIVGEHEPDEMAFDPRHPYYDAKSTRENPKWDIVYVQYVRKFADKVKLSELKSYAEPGGALSKMQMLKQARLSVSAVTPKEWKFILDLAREDLDEDDSEQAEDTLDENANGADKMKAGNLVHGGAEEGDDEGVDDEENVDGDDDGNDDGNGEDGAEGVNGAYDEEDK
ncbi:hypothetical protein GJ744_007867 [Endocarpon pusillum]|uniref:Thymocyte nuclear protein 1 n=1 Tax=Endocarpon pusillum TaxID=364733 RepID=A0A8H7AVL6_9EURO|nr:hypothetical protein GJ744_007867 [Endocarpon pusillum]